MTAPTALAIAGLIVVLLLARAVSRRPHPDAATAPEPFWRCPRCGETDDFEDADFGQAFRCRVCGFLDYNDLEL